MSNGFKVYTRESSKPCYSAATEAEAQAWGRQNLASYRVTRAGSAGGWLVVLIGWLYLSVPLGLLMVWGSLLALERQGLGFDMAYGALKVITWALALVLAAIQLYVAWSLHHDFQPGTIFFAKKFLLWGIIGASFVGQLVLPTSLFGISPDLIVAGLVKTVSAAIVAAIPVLYLSFSKRVRRTFGLVTESSGDATDVAASPLPTTPKEGTKPIKPTAPMPAVPAPSNPPAPQAPPHLVPVPVQPMEEHWAGALAEYEGPTRRPGLYARAFAEAGGVEAATKAKYLAARAQELADEYKRLALAREADHERHRAEQLALWEKQTSDFEKSRRLRALTSWGTCPNCNWTVPMDAPMCHRCGATFDEGSAWQLRSIAIDERRALVEEELGRQRSITGRQLSDVIAMAESDPSVLTIYVHGDTLLHKAAEFNMREEVKHLLALGADPTKTNAQGKTPAEVAASDAIKHMLASGRS